MRAAVRHDADEGGPSLPDPSDYVATVAAVDAANWTAATIDAAADTGFLVGGRDRVIAGFGVAAALALPRGLEDARALGSVREWLGAVESTGPVPGPVALGAFPFDRAAPGSLVVPSVTLWRDGSGATWRTEVRRRDATASGEGPDAARARPLGGGIPGGARTGALDPAALRQVPEPAGYVDAVARAVGDIRSGALRKVVLGRMVEARLPAPVAPSALLRALWRTEGIFSPFSVPIPSGRLVGASPELVVARHGRTVLSHALGGTVPLSGTGDADARRLLDSAKDRAEHGLVVEEVVRALEPRCEELSVPAAPTVVRLRSDARLGTLVRGTLRAGPLSEATALALLSALHPTPAVGGVPRAEALERIASLEPVTRGYWAGAVGWLDASGDGEWVLAIRSVELDGPRARARAGAGIVRDSDPRAELAETSVKLRPVLDALWPGAAALL